MVNFIKNFQKHHGYQELRNIDFGNKEINFFGKILKVRELRGNYKQ